MHVLIQALHRPVKPTGVCRHAANLAQCLAESEHVSLVTVLIGCWQSVYFEQTFGLESPKIKVFPVDITNSSLSRNRWFITGLPKLARQLQPDVIHLSFPLPFVRQWFEMPVVSTIHDLYPYECPENFGYPQVWFNQWFLKNCIRESDGLACVSRVTLDLLNQFFPPGQLVRDRSVNRSLQRREVIYNYVDFAQVEIEVPESLSTSEFVDIEHPDFLLCVAQHRKNKNIDLLIKAYAQLLENKTIEETTQLLVVGSTGPETEPLRELIASLSLKEKVVFLSALTDGELCWLYKHCRLFAIASSTEGFCLPLVEALFWGAKVVCSRIPIFEEVGSSSCTYFELEDTPIANLAAAITHTLNSPPSRTSAVRSDLLKGNVAQKLVTFYTSVGAEATAKASTRASKRSVH